MGISRLNRFIQITSGDLRVYDITVQYGKQILIQLMCTWLKFYQNLIQHKHKNGQAESMTKAGVLLRNSSSLL